MRNKHEGVNQKLTCLLLKSGQTKEFTLVYH